MPTTTYTDPTLDVAYIGARTDPAGTEVDDVAADEARLLNSVFTPGIVRLDDFRVSPASTPGMVVEVGSGVPNNDLAFVPSTASGQGQYLIRLVPGAESVTVPAASVSETRIDQVYLVVRDNPYDGSGIATARIGYRQGDDGGGPPGPDPSWTAYLLLADITVEANESSITGSEIGEQRGFAHPLVQLDEESVTSQKLVDLAVTNAKLGPTAVTADKIANSAVTGAKGAPTFLQSFEVDGYVEVASAGTATSEGAVATVTLAIPVTWGSWKCFAAAHAENVTGTNQFRLRIDGTSLQLVTDGVGGNQPFAVIGRRAGMTTTGNRTVELRARSLTGSPGSFADIALYARAVRTG